MSEAPPATCVAGIVLFHGVEEIDFAAPYGVFCALRRLQIESRDAALPETHVLTVARTPGILHGANGLRLLADFDWTMCPPLDVLIIPGSGEIGEPTVPEMEDAGLWDWVHDRALQSRYVASVGTGAFVLAKAGILEGKRATTLAPYRSRLGRFGAVPVEEPLVEDGKIVTAASGAWGIALGIRLVARLSGESASRRVARALETDPVSGALPST